MNLSVEVSMYPLQDGYMPIIDSFLENINSNDALVEIRTSNMSTRMFGPYDEVMNVLNQAMKESMQAYGKIVFVCKFLEGDARELANYS